MTESRVPSERAIASGRGGPRGGEEVRDGQELGREDRAGAQARTQAPHQDAAVRIEPAGEEDGLWARARHPSSEAGVVARPRVPLRERDDLEPEPARRAPEEDRPRQPELRVAVVQHRDAAGAEQASEDSVGCGLVLVTGRDACEVAAAVGVQAPLLA